MFRISKMIQKRTACPKDKPYQLQESPLAQRLVYMLEAVKGGDAYRMALKNEVMLYYVFDHGEAIAIGVELYLPECTFAVESRFPRADAEHFRVDEFEKVLNTCVEELLRKGRCGELAYQKCVPYEVYKLDCKAV